MSEQVGETVEVSANTLNSLLAAAAAYFGMALEGYPFPVSRQELQAIQRAIKGAVSVLGLEGEPTLQKLIDAEV